MRAKIRHTPYPDFAPGGPHHGRIGPGRHGASRLARTRGARTTGGFTTTGFTGFSPTTSTPSTRQIGRKIRPTAGRSRNNACIASWLSKCCNCDPNAATSQPNSRTSHARPDGNRTPGTAGAHATRLAVTRPRTGPVAARSNRRTAAFNQRHNGSASRSKSGRRNTSRAITAINPAKMAPNARTASGASVDGVKGAAAFMLF